MAHVRHWSRASRARAVSSTAGVAALALALAGCGQADPAAPRPSAGQAAFRAPALAIPAPRAVGRGCTTAFYVDEDCDGYVTGGKEVPDLLPPAGPDVVPPRLAPDADDADPTVNTPASAQARYGSFKVIANFKRYLAALGYTHAIGDVYFISPSGNNATARPNDVTRPFKDRPIPVKAPRIQPGDVVVYRGGTYAGGFDTQGYGYRKHATSRGLAGTAARPILLINYPGERVIFRGSYSAGELTRGTRYVIIQGFEFDGAYAPGKFATRGFELGGSEIHHVVLRRVEMRNARWGIFTTVAGVRDDIVLDRVVAHDTTTEHCLYVNDVGQGQRRWIIYRSLFYRCHRHGLQLRGYLDDFVIAENIVHSNALSGIEVKNGMQRALVFSNVIFNNGRTAITFHGHEEPAGAERPIRDNYVFHNTLAVGEARNGMGQSCRTLGPGCMDENPTQFSAVMYRHSENASRGWVFGGNAFFYNVIVTRKQPAISFDRAADVAATYLYRNLVQRVTPGSGGKDLAGMEVCGWTDGTHDLKTGRTYCNPAYRWNLASMQDPTRRPGMWESRLGDPAFTAASPAYAKDPGRYLLRPARDHRGVDIALGGVVSVPLTADVSGEPIHAAADAGAYELAAPVLLSVTPSAIAFGRAATVRLDGKNFDATAWPLVGTAPLPASMIRGRGVNRITLAIPAGIPRAAYPLRVGNANAKLSAARLLTVR